MAEILLAPIEGLITGGIGHVIGNIVKNIGEKVKHNPALMILTALMITILNPTTYFIFGAAYLIVFITKGGFKTAWNDLKESITAKGKTTTQRLHLFIKKLYDDTKRLLWITFASTMIICFIINVIVLLFFLNVLPGILFILGFFSTTIVGEIIGIIGLPAGI